MIKNKKQLDFYIRADLMMNRGIFNYSLKDRVYRLFCPDYVMIFLRLLRKCEYIDNTGGLRKHPFGIITKIRLRELGIKLGFTISPNSLGYGVVIPHYGTIVVGGNNIGNYAVLHTSICITGNGKTIGDAFYCSTGVKVTTKCVINNNVSVGANSLVNKSFDEGNCLIGGTPAKFIKSSEPWYIRDKLYTTRHERVEELKKIIGYEE